MNEKIVLIGAGSAMFTRGLLADMIQHGWEADLSLVDIDPVALSVAEGLAKKMINEKKAPIRLSAATDRREVLSGATAVISTIGVGGRRSWEQDVIIPRRHGIFQPVGDSVAPGGTSRALRMIPAMVEIAQDVLDMAPSALFFNYANPMSAICRGVIKATGANIIGLCHGVFHVEQYLAAVLGVPSGSLKCTSMGINHLTWFTEVRCSGRDMMPALQEEAAKRLAQPISWKTLGNTFAEAGTADRTNVADDNRLSWEMFLLFNAFPAVMDRHITEFFPGIFCREKAYYGKSLGIEAYSFEEVITYGDKIYEEMKDLATSDKSLPADYFDRLSGEHEQVLDIIRSIRNDDGKIYSASLPNHGQVPNLPENAVIESPALAMGGTLRPIQQKPMPSGIAGTLATRFQWAETTVEAAIEGNRTKFIQALLLDGAVQSLPMASKLADELLASQAAFLPQF